MSFRLSLFAIFLLVCGGIFGVVKEHQHVSSNSPDLSIDNAHRRLQYSQQQEQERPTMYTYHEPSAQYNPNDDSMDLLENWRKSWYDMGWNPVILTPQQAETLPQYQELMSLIPEGDLVTEEAITSYKKWIAMAAVGGGWFADVNVWPLNYFLRHGRALPYDGQLTLYMGPTTPVLISGTGEEYLRLAHQIGQTASKIIGHQKWLNENYPEAYKPSVPWNDGVALKELRDNVSKDMFKVRGDVVEKGRVINKQTQEVDCGNSDGKRAVYFRALAAKEGENRGTIARKFLNSWRAACEVGQVPEILPPGKAKQAMAI